MVLMSLWLPFSSEISIKSPVQKANAFFILDEKCWIRLSLPNTMSTICRMGKMLKCCVNLTFNSENVVERASLWLWKSKQNNRERVFLFHTVLIEIRTFLLFWRLCDSITCKFVKRIPLGQKLMVNSTLWCSTESGSKKVKVSFWTEI